MRSFCKRSTPHPNCNAWWKIKQHSEQIHTGEPCYNGHEYKGYPDITVKLFSPNYIVAFQFYLIIKVTLIKEPGFHVPMGLLYRGPTVLYKFISVYCCNHNYAFQTSLLTRYSRSSRFLEAIISIREHLQTSYFQPLFSGFSYKWLI